MVLEFEKRQLLVLQKHLEPLLELKVMLKMQLVLATFSMPKFVITQYYFNTDGLSSPFFLKSQSNLAKLKTVNARNNQSLVVTSSSNYIFDENCIKFNAKFKKE